MSAPFSPDVRRSIEAARVVLDGRDPVKDMAEVMITLEHMVATLLLAATNRESRRAAQLLNEGLVPRVEFRISLNAQKGGSA